jgi:hypothetical protein
VPTLPDARPPAAGDGDGDEDASVLDRYTSDVLTRQLAACGLMADQIAPIVADVAVRLRAVLSRWNAASFRDPLLLLGWEEGSFYAPASVDTATRALVVVAVRNSLVESIGSRDPTAVRYGLSSLDVPDDVMPALTGAAAEAFGRVDLAALAGTVPVPPADADPYGHLPERYPAAWAALTALAGLTETPRREARYAAVTPNADVVVAATSGDAEEEGTPEEGTSTDERSPVLDVQLVVSGIDPRLTPEDRELLRSMRDGHLDVLLLPSFKHCSRHPDKLLTFLECAFASGVAVVTPNYLLTNGHVCRRRRLVRPAHYNREIQSRLDDRRGLTPTHARWIDAVAPRASARRGRG